VMIHRVSRKIEAPPAHLSPPRSGGHDERQPGAKKLCSVGKGELRHAGPVNGHTIRKRTVSAGGSAAAHCVVPELGPTKCIAAQAETIGTTRIDRSYTG